jgi:hypothetical protein
MIDFLCRSTISSLLKSQPSLLLTVPRVDSAGYMTAHEQDSYMPQHSQDSRQPHGLTILTGLVAAGGAMIDEMDNKL